MNSLFVKHKIYQILFYFFIIFILNKRTIKKGPNISFYKYDIVVLITTCDEKIAFNSSKLQLPSYKIRCNNESKLIDCKEAVPLLKYFYNVYDNPPAKKFIVIHGHETSWHYEKSISNTVNQIIFTNYFKSNSYGALLKTGWHNDIPWKENSLQGVYFKDLFRSIYYNTSMEKYFNAKELSFPCCSTFFFDSQKLKTRKKEEYLTIINRLNNYSIHCTNAFGPSYWCSRIMEYTWHILLSGKTKVPPPSY